MLCDDLISMRDHGLRARKNLTFFDLQNASAQEESADLFSAPAADVPVTTSRSSGFETVARCSARPCASGATAPRPNAAAEFRFGRFSRRARGESIAFQMARRRVNEDSDQDPEPIHTGAARALWFKLKRTVHVDFLVVAA